MRKILPLLHYRIKYTVRTKCKPVWNAFHMRYTHREYYATFDETGKCIKQLILAGEPMMVCRIGANESFSLRTFEFDDRKRKDKALKQLCSCAGFFPDDVRAGEQFLQVMKDAMGYMDICGTLQCPMDDYFIEHYAPKNCKVTYLDRIDSTSQDEPWTALLKGKKVLVVHPFAKTIEMQYQKRERLFPGRDVLPEFELITYRAVQTSAGQTDDRFKSWFEALRYMAGEIAQIDFDIALLGCGAYGLPLAAEIKKLGRQAVQIGGSLQTLFGIKGKRWDEMPDVAAMYNEAWTYPLPEETPSGAEMVENGCYWK